MTTTSARALLGVIALAASVATLDAGRAGSWDLVVLCAVAALCAVLLLAAGVNGRTPTTVRADLARWLERSAAGSGERAIDVADRAIAAYRAGLTELPLERDGASATG